MLHPSARRILVVVFRQMWQSLQRSMGVIRGSIAGDQSGKRRNSHSLGDEVSACRSGPRSGKLRPGEISRNFRDDVTNNEPEVTVQDHKGSVLLGTSV